MIIADRGSEFDRLLQNPDNRSFEDLRDGAAFIYVTGAWPKHLPPRSDQLLSFCTDWVRQRGSAGRFVIANHVAEKLDLNDHPLVQTVQRYEDLGYRVHNGSCGSGEHCHPFGMVRMFEAEAGNQPIADRVTILLNGSTKPGW
jgi:hypothetical protein